MSDSIKLSPKYGLNPTIPVCFWCGKDREEIAFMGRIGDSKSHEDIEASRYMVVDYDPCEDCKRNMALGFTVIEATSKPNEITSVALKKGVYPTSRYVVIEQEDAKEVFGEDIAATGRAFLKPELFEEIFL